MNDSDFKKLSAAEPRTRFSHKLLIFSALSMLLLPIVTGFCIKFLMLSTLGNIMYTDLYSILGYAYDIITFVVLYLTTALFASSLLRYGVRRSTAVIAMYIGSMILPYVGTMAAEALTSVDFAENILLYIVISLTSFAFDLIIFIAVFIICTAVRKRLIKNEVPPPASYYSPFKNPTARAMLCITAVITLIALGQEIYSTVNFFINYGFTATAGETVTIIITYLLILTKALIGYIIMCAVAHAAK